MSEIIMVNGTDYDAGKLKMVEIYGGENPDWKGWHNLILDMGSPEIDKPIAGPIDPETSEQLKAAIDAISSRPTHNGGESDHG